jgi:predicted nucleic acid-binding protein
MILADTSVWIDHFRRGSASFARQLEAGEVATHIVVVGQLATGNLLHRHETLAALRRLPRVKQGTSDECFAYLETHRLFGVGIGWSDIQLLVAAQLSQARLWSLDRPLAMAAKKLDLLFVDEG